MQIPDIPDILDILDEAIAKTTAERQQQCKAELVPRYMNIIRKGQP